MVAAGGLRRDPARLSGRLPVGPTLAETLRRACADDDKHLLRSATRRWIALAGPDPFATADNLVLVGTDWQVADPSYSLVAPVEVDVAVARCLRHFAVGLLAGGYAHPWLPGMDADALARMLAGLAERHAAAGGAGRGGRVGGCHLGGDAGAVG